MRAFNPPGSRASAAALIAAALILAAAAAAAGSLSRLDVATVAIPAGATRTISVPYPDALKYANARYSGRSVVLGPAAGAEGRRPDPGKVRILAAGSIEGGSLYRVRAHNANATGTAALRLRVTATTVEPLPHR